jgi:hypothetical protein
MDYWVCWDFVHIINSIASDHRPLYEMLTFLYVALHSSVGMISLRKAVGFLILFGGAPARRSTELYDYITERPLHTCAVT